MTGEVEASDDRESEEIVRRTFITLAEWQLRAVNPYLPLPKSELALSDNDWLPQSLSTVAMFGLVAATDHLNAIRGHVERHQLFPMAHLTLCRSALVGAAQAVWVLAPDDNAERVLRCRTINTDMYKKHLQYLRGLQDLSDSRHEGTDKVAAHVEMRLNELQAKRSADGQFARLDTTNMIREAAAAAFVKQDLVDQVVLAWRSGSGTAHGFAWPLFGTAGTIQTSRADGDGIAEFTAGGSLARIANAYMAAFHLAAHGWELLAKRAGSGSAV